MLQVPLVVVVLLLSVSVPAIVCPDEKPAKAIIVRNIQMYLPVSFETENKSCLRFTGILLAIYPAMRHCALVLIRDAIVFVSPVAIISIKRSTLEKRSHFGTLCGFKGSNNVSGCARLIV
jgi:hypothetical protein